MYPQSIIPAFLITYFVMILCLSFLAHVYTTIDSEEFPGAKPHLLGLTAFGAVALTVAAYYFIQHVNFYPL